MTFIYKTAKVCSSLDHFSQNTRDFVHQTSTEHALFRETLQLSSLSVGFCSSFRYFLLPAFLGDLSMRKISEDRCSVVENSKVCIYLAICKYIEEIPYGITPQYLIN